MSEENTENAKEPGAKSLINITATDFFGLGKLANSPAAAQIVASVSGAIGGLWSPVGSMLNKEAEGFERRRQAGLDAKEAKEVEALYADNPEIAAVTKARILGIEFRRTERIIRATRRAAEIADAHATNSTTKAAPVDPDFASEWVEAVKDVSDADVVEIFATLLASAPESSSGRPPSQVLKLAQQLDADAARLLRLLMAEWLLTMPVPVGRVQLLIDDDQHSTLLMMQESGFLVKDQTVTISVPPWGVSFHPVRPPKQELNTVRTPIDVYRPTETCRRLINLLVERADIEPPIEDFLSNWRVWFPPSDAYVLKLNEQAFRLLKGRMNPVIVAGPIDLKNADALKPKLKTWLNDVYNQGYLAELRFNEDEQVFSGRVTV